MDRSPASELTLPVSKLRDDLKTVLDSAVDAVHAGRLVERALIDPEVRALMSHARAVDVLAAGKASAVMLSAFASSDVHVRRMLAIGPGRPASLPTGAGWCEAGHPLPNEGSLEGARRAMELAAASNGDDLLVVLLSGGGSALMALPAPGISLSEKQAAVGVLLAQSADITELNTVRKHLSAIKGGQLAAASSGKVMTLAVSDVVGDDLSVIASGPTVADESTFADALAVLERRGGPSRFPASVVARLRAGAAGELAETPAKGDARLARASARVIGPQRGAIDGARSAAMKLGYWVHVIDQPVTGEARVAAAEHSARLTQLARGVPRPACVISAGETTVTVVGSGRGGRNQEFSFAFAQTLDRLGAAVVAASMGTDGIDGPTDAAGAIVDPSTFERAKASGIPDPVAYLNDNNTYAFFERLNDLIRTGPTSTNVGDIQVVLLG